ncbi:MAG: hypothetical protein JXB32_04700, partial [Deltaproteobacteria bacterium]|nr:hypothetical protein [Deltaproteobacteria bacterium]
AAAEAAAAPTDCVGGTVGAHGWHGAPIPTPPTQWDQLPGCERANVVTGVFAYDPQHDAWGSRREVPSTRQETLHSDDIAPRAPSAP